MTCDYPNDKGRITAPGRFEGQPIFAPYFWNMALDGMADADDGYVFTFRLHKSDPEVADCPALKDWLGRKHYCLLRISQDANGFIRCF